MRRQNLDGLGLVAGGRLLTAPFGAGGAIGGLAGGGLQSYYGGGLQSYYGGNTASDYLANALRSGLTARQSRNAYFNDYKDQGIDLRDLCPKRRAKPKSDEQKARQRAKAEAKRREKGIVPRVKLSEAEKKKRANERARARRISNKAKVKAMLAQGYVNMPGVGLVQPGEVLAQTPRLRGQGLVSGGRRMIR